MIDDPAAEVLAEALAGVVVVATVSRVAPVRDSEFVVAIDWAATGEVEAMTVSRCTELATDATLAVDDAVRSDGPVAVIERRTAASGDFLTSSVAAIDRVVTGLVAGVGAVAKSASAEGPPVLFVFFGSSFAPPKLRTGGLLLWLPVALVCETLPAPMDAAEVVGDSWLRCLPAESSLLVSAQATP